MLVQFQVYNAVTSEGTFRSGDTRAIAVRAEAIDTIEAPAEPHEGTPDEKSVPQLHVAGRAYLLAESWEHAVEKWENALLGEPLESLEDEDDDFSDETTLDRVASGVLMQALAAISSNPTQLPELTTLSEDELTDLRLGLEAWAESRLGDPDDDDDDAWDADNEEDDDDEA